MYRMPSTSCSLIAISLASLIAHSGCSETSSTPIDTKATLEKATGGGPKVKLSDEAKAADEKSAKQNPKLY